MEQLNGLNKNIAIEPLFAERIFGEDVRYETSYNIFNKGDGKHLKMLFLASGDGLSRCTM